MRHVSRYNDTSRVAADAKSTSFNLPIIGKEKGQ
jgi:hypothetical protein|tara:strand:- start:314 stop:415 length:102 start_codon:yes stop_codon:yes gene_type:complete